MSPFGGWDSTSLHVDNGTSFTALSFSACALSFEETGSSLHAQMAERRKIPNIIMIDHVTFHHRLRCIWMAVMAAGVIPEILAACPRDKGLILLSFSLTSWVSPWTVW
jgi:hypothetical protein